MIYTVTLNPALDKTARVDSFELDSVNRVVELRQDPGGKGINVSKVIAKLGGTSRALAILAGTTGKAIANALEELSVACWPYTVPGETRTNLKVVDPVLDTHTDINEPGPVVSTETLDDMLGLLTKSINPADIVVISGSLPKGAPRDTYAIWTRACTEAGARVLLDADGDALKEGLAGTPYLIKPNEHELARLIGRPLESPAEIAQAAKELLDRGIKRVVVSMGGAGALFVNEERVVMAHAPKVPVSSTVGAGDSVVAALAYAIDNVYPFEQAAKLAVATGSANVMSAGTQAAEFAQIEPLIDQVTLEEI